MILSKRKEDSLRSQSALWRHLAFAVAGICLVPAVVWGWQVTTRTKMPAGSVPGWNLRQRANDKTQPNYVRGLDTAIKHSGKTSAVIRSAKPGAFGTLLQAVSANNYRGKRVRLTGWMKTNDVERAGFWVRVDGETRSLAFDNMQADRPVTGTTNWTEYSVVLDVPQESVGIHFGCLLIGEGQMWIDDLKFETVAPKKVEVTAIAPTGLQEQGMSLRRLYTGASPSPINLGFEQ